ncbi:RDD family protein [Salsipaludibacter albus]|uniref:RDD family protein n=1 Tax=Salsipaludibacter albus TaxID=2849650 RepID=UPI001EE4D166|nr:RDD family protein [Salsipaludibacter albus]
MGDQATARNPGVGAGAARSTRGLVTGEAVELEIPTATVGLRGLAYLVDLVVLAILVIAVIWGGFALVATVFSNDVGAADAGAWVVITLVGAMLIVVPAGIEWLTHGRSLGKVVAKLRVVTVSAAPISLRHALVRATVGVFELILTGGIVAFLAALASPRGQRLGDLVAGTLVVRESVTRADISPVRFTPPSGTASLAARLDVTALDDGDYRVIRSTVLRSGLDPERHAHLCGVVVRSVWPRISDLPLPTAMPAPDVLTAIAAAYQDQHAPADGSRATDWVWSHR